MTERQNQKRHHCHGDAGKSGTDDLLPPCQQAERDGIGEHAHTKAMQPDPPVQCGAGARQPVAPDKGNGGQQDGGKNDPAGRHP